MITSQFSFDKSQAAVYGQLINELHSHHPVLDIRTEKALQAIFSLPHDNFSLLSKDIDNIKADWALRDEVKELAEKLFKLEHFKWQVGGRKFHNSQQTNSIANIYKQFLEHKINLKQLHTKVSQLTGIEQSTLVKADKFIEKAVDHEIESKADQFKISLGGHAFQNSTSTLKMANLYAKYLKGELTAYELFTSIDTTQVPPSIKENSKTIIKSMLSSSEKRELKGYDRLQAFRVAVGGAHHMHSATTNNLIALYKHYIENNIDIHHLHQALDDAIGNENSAAAKAIVFRSDLGGNNYYNSASTIQISSFYNSYLKGEINVEQLFYKIDEQPVHYTVKDASKDLIRASLQPGEKKLLKNYDKVQAFRSLVGEGGHLHGPLTNNIVNLYKDYVDEKITLRTLYTP